MRVPRDGAPRLEDARDAPVFPRGDAANLSLLSVSGDGESELRPSPPRRDEPRVRVPADHTLGDLAAAALGGSLGVPRARARDHTAGHAPAGERVAAAASARIPRLFPEESVEPPGSNRAERLAIQDPTAVVTNPAVGDHDGAVPRDEAPRAPSRQVSTRALPRPHVLDPFRGFDPRRLAPAPREPTRERRLPPSRRADLLRALHVQPVRRATLHHAPNLERHLRAPPRNLPNVILRSSVHRPAPDLDPSTQALHEPALAVPRDEPARRDRTGAAADLHEHAPRVKRARDPRRSRRAEACGHRRPENYPRGDAATPSR